MRKLVYAASSLVMSGIAFAATKAAPAPDLPSQIMSGFNTILAGSTGLKVAVAVIFVAGAAVGYWKGSSGGF
jgi:hypothetical protein